MKVAVISANGKSGKLIVKEAVSKGYEVTGIVRSKKEDLGIPLIQKDLFDLTYEDLKAFDVIVDAFGVWDPEQMNLHQTTLKHLCDILSDKPNRLIVVGGGGSLYVNPEHTVQLMNTPEFPKEYMGVATNMSLGLDLLRSKSDVKWTYLSPAAFYDPEGIRSGSYQLGDEELIVNTKGDSYVSYPDYAVALVDEIGKAKYVQKRFTVVSG